MSTTPIFDSLSEEDRNVVDHHVSGLVNRSLQVEKDGHAHAFDVHAETEKTAKLLQQGGATATYLRSAYDAANPSRTVEPDEAFSR